jgi:hypothetical protein
MVCHSFGRTTLRVRLLTTACVVGFLVGCSRAVPHAAPIEKVIAADIALQHAAERRMGLWEKYWDRSAIIGQYAGQIAALDLSECPADFQQAYLAHTQAWASFHRQLANNSGFNGFVKGLLLPYRIGDVVLEGENEQKQIQSTWFAVERVAQKYGVVAATLDQRDRAPTAIPSNYSAFPID